MIENFKLFPFEALKAKNFEREHLHPEVYKGAIGGHITYKFIPNSIGRTVSIKCSICDAQENITDYDLW